MTLTKSGAALELRSGAMTRLVLAVLVAVLVVVAACRQGPAPAARAPTAVRVHAVERAAAAAAARYSATINPAARVDLAFKNGGYVESVAKVVGLDGKPRLLQAGDKVTHGQILASVRRADFAQKLAEARAGLGEAQAAAEQAQLNFDRAANLIKTSSISKAESDSARVALDAASARVAGARVRVEEADTALADTLLRTPMDGVVLARNVEIGTLAAPGMVALSIVDTSTVKVVFGVPDTVLETLQLGADQAVATEAMHGGERTGKITRIAPVADPRSHVFEVEVTLDNPGDELKAGMVASLNLGAAAAAPVAVLPLAAIVRPPAGLARPSGQQVGYAVFVVDASGVARARGVELGDLLGNQIPIKSGLAEGEKVVVMGASLLSDGENVQVIP
jgi:RND family efflux transporter MFP subunit